MGKQQEYGLIFFAGGGVFGNNSNIFTLKIALKSFVVEIARLKNLV